jgi:hypothetical protein
MCWFARACASEVRVVARRVQAATAPVAGARSASAMNRDGRVGLP